MVDEIRFENVWKNPNPKVTKDAIALWTELKMLPRNVTPEDRAAELVSVAYVGDRLAGVTTATIHYYEPVRQLFAFLRILIHPDFEKGGVSVPLTIAAREDLRQWSIDHPEQNVAGAAFIITAAGYGEATYTPAGFYLGGYSPQGHQVRLYWWEHYKLPLQMPPLRNMHSSY
ncbi:MAG: hypothetical protein GC184_03755 [Rhizobiales bacterium]|nr:hypothetical protein [Hyphomicrobiales bacterium]